MAITNSQPYLKTKPYLKAKPQLKAIARCTLAGLEFFFSLSLWVSFDVCWLLVWNRYDMMILLVVVCVCAQHGHS